MVERVVATPRARALIHRLRQQYGPLLVRAADEGEGADVLPRGGGEADLLLGDVEGCPIYVSRSEQQHWRYAQLIIDAEAPDSPTMPDVAALLARSRRFSTEEWADLNRGG